MQIGQKSKRVRAVPAEAVCPLALLIATVGFRQVNPNLTAENFTQKKKSLHLRSNARVRTATDLGVSTPRTHDILCDMRERGFQPANLMELLAFAKSGWNGIGTVVALETIWTSARTGKCYAACLIGSGGDRDLCLRRAHLGTRWDKNCQFLVITK